MRSVAGAHRRGKVPSQGIRCERDQGVDVAPRSEEFEGTDADMARCHACEHGARKGRVAKDGLARRDRGEERVVGIPRAAMASLTMYSRRTGPSAARPSPPRENGVRPEPLS